jgi:hypothetical protein
MLPQKHMETQMNNTSRSHGLWEAAAPPPPKTQTLEPSTDDDRQCALADRGIGYRPWRAVSADAH